MRTACRRAGVEPDVRHDVTDTAATLALMDVLRAVAETRRGIVA